MFSKAAASEKGEPTLKAALDALPAPVSSTPTMTEDTGTGSEGELKSKSDQLKDILAGNPQTSAPKNKPAPKKKSLGIDFSKRPKKDQK